LDVLDLAEGVALLRTRVDVSDEIAVQIAEELGLLPLALEQAAAYLDTSKIPSGEYLALLKTRAEQLHRKGAVAGRRGDTIATLWDISLATLTTQSPEALQLLRVCAYMAPVPIPLDLFTRHSDLLPEPLASAAHDPLEFNDVLAVIVDYSLAKRAPEGLLLHRLVQAAIRSQHRHVERESAGRGGPR
jgi:hypothetical protein